MEERLIVKNFGPIKDIDIRIGKLTVLIGEQATGKSTLGKLLAVCRYFSYIIDPRFGVLNEFEVGLNAWGLEGAIKTETSRIEYHCRHYILKVSSILQEERDYETGEVDGVYPDWTIHLEPVSEEFIQLLKEFEKVKPSGTGYGHGLGWQIPTSFLQNEVAQVLDNPFYLPAERGLQSIFSLGRNSIQNISDSLFNQFAELDQIARNFPTDLHIQPLDIEYKNDAGKGYFKKRGEDKYQSMQTAASGYQSTVPIVLLLEYYTQIRKKKKTFIIEEPELNLFPTTQHRLMQYLVSNLNKTENQIILTTHSPYVLAALNNMLSAYKSGQVNKEQTAAVLPADYWLNADAVTAYRLLPDGTAKDLMNREMSLLESEEIDEVSEEINRQFDELITIQLEHENG